ncbi:MAG TPA: hypothetical protein VFW33_07135 [Gemmataceae bacterium]|nr:hypothetical protein [Gemmataceae bacterium]
MTTCPPHGIPDDMAGALGDLLAWVRRHRDAGRPAGEVRADALHLAHGAGLPMYSAGGAADCINALLAEAPGVAA